MKHLLYVTITVAMTALAFTACTKYGHNRDKYVAALREVAGQYEAKCPRINNAGDTLVSVTFSDNTLFFRSLVSRDALTERNLDSVRQAVITNMSKRLKKYLAMGNCNMVCKYVAGTDSAVITIVPSELNDTIN